MQVAALFPFLVVAGPALPAIIAGILAVAIGVAMSIIMFRAFAGILQKPFTFAQLWQGFVKTCREMTVGKAVGYFFKGLIIAFAIFSLFFLCSTGVPTLATAFGVTVAHLFGFASFVGQIPFCAVTISNFCNFVADWVTTKFFSKEHALSGKISQRLSEPTWSKQGFFRRCLSFIKQVFVPGALPANAAGNGALVVVPNSPITYVAAAGNTLISVAGNMVPDEVGEARERIQADKVIVHEIIKAPKVNSPNDDTHSDLSTIGGTTRVLPPQRHKKGVFSSRHLAFLCQGKPRYAPLNDEETIPIPAGRATPLRA